MLSVLVTSALPVILIAFGISLLVSLAATPLLRGLAIRMNITDRPDAVLKPHARPIAYLGGVGFYVGWLAGLAAVQWLRPDWLDSRVWVMGGLGGVILAVGLADDIWNIKPWQRLAAETTVAVLMFTFQARFLATPGLAPGGTPAMGVALAVQIVLIIGACNSTNVLDGLDGLCGGVCAIVLFGLAALAYSVYVGQARPVSLQQLKMVVVLAAPMSAALLGFLRYNYRPASIFMGDAGSLLLGFVIASCIILLAVPGWTGLTLAFSGLVVFAVPICDAGLAFVRRGLNHRPLFAGDRSHFYDQLVDRGLPVRRTVNICYLLAAITAALGWIGAVRIGRFGWSMALYGAALAVVVLLLWKFGFVRVDKPRDQ